MIPWIPCIVLRYFSTISSVRTLCVYKHSVRSIRWESRFPYQTFSFCILYWYSSGRSQIYAFSGEVGKLCDVSIKKGTKWWITPLPFLWWMRVCVSVCRIETKNQSFYFLLHTPRCIHQRKYKRDVYFVYTLEWLAMHARLLIFCFQCFVKA